MRQLINNFKDNYFRPSLGIQVQAFNLLACAGIAAGLLVALSSLLTNAGIINAAANLLTSIFTLFLLRFARKSGRYRFCYVLTVVAVFIIAFPVMFFTAGGYRSGMPSFYVFALVFTAFMLESNIRIIAIILEIVIYIGSCIVAHLYPHFVKAFATDTEYLVDVIVGIVVSGTLLTAAIALYIRIYNDRQAFIEAQSHEIVERNRELEQYRVTRGPLTLELSKSQALVVGQDIGLTKKEFSVLLLLVQNEGKQLSADDIYETVWGASANGDTKAIRNHISALRRKIAFYSADGIEINYRYGKGYLFLPVGIRLKYVIPPVLNIF